MTERRPTATWRRYLLWQAPGWLAGAAVLAAVAVVLGLSWWIVAAGVALLVVRDVALYPAMRAVFAPAPPVRPVGAHGIAVERLDPEGLVRVQGELWRARAVSGPILEGEDVVVAAATGLTLSVRRPS